MHKKMLEHNRNTRKEKVLDHNGNTHKVEMHTQMEVLMHIRRKQSCRNPLREDLHGGCIFGFFGDNIFQQLCNQNDIGIHARHCSSSPGKHLASHIDLMSGLLLVNLEHHQSSSFIRNRLACSAIFTRHCIMEWCASLCKMKTMKCMENA